MSAENVEIVRRVVESFKRRDNEYPFTVFDGDIDWDMRFMAGDVGQTGLRRRYRGHDGVREFWREWLDAWSEIEFGYEIEDLGFGRVAVFITQRNRGRASGIRVEQIPYVLVYTLRDGMVQRVEFAAPDEVRAG